MGEDLRNCPFCGSDRLVRSVNGGVLPSYMGPDEQLEIFEKTPYVVTCELSCELCGARVEGYSASDIFRNDTCEKAIKNCYEKWNKRCAYA